mgnify:CR=1 FL=1
MRIDKYLANMNVGSRKEVHQLIKKGIVAVNDVIVKTPKQQVKESDQVLSLIHISEPTRLLSMLLLIKNIIISY